MRADRQVNRVLVDSPFFGLAARVLDLFKPRGFNTMGETLFQKLSVVFRKSVNKF